MKLTNNFSYDEFIENSFANKEEILKIKFSVTDEVEKNIPELAKNLQVLRDHLNAAIKINIGFRPVWWEKRKGRSGKSMHCKGMAADIVVSGHTSFQVATAIEKLISEGKMKQGGLKGYGTFTHYDIRGTRARW